MLLFSPYFFFIIVVRKVNEEQNKREDKKKSTNEKMNENEKWIKNLFQLKIELCYVAQYSMDPLRSLDHKRNEQQL